MHVRAGLVPLIALAAAAAVSSPAPPVSAPPAAVPLPDDQLVQQACGTCHRVPPPDIMPREAWSGLVYQMAVLALGGIGTREGGPDPMLDFDVERVVRIYENGAPLRLPDPPPWPAVDRTRLRFERRGYDLPDRKEAPAVAHVRFVDLNRDSRPELVATDMIEGVVLQAPIGTDPAGRTLEVIGRVPNPCRAEPVDLDRDGRLDLLIADLGGVTPADHHKGSVVWLQQRAEGGFQARTLAAGLPRVSDVRAADFDADGDLDLVVAAFGWRTVGATLLLENRTRDWTSPSFVRRDIDTRVGAIHVPPADLDRDGRPDFVGLISQHHETVAAFLNTGVGAFRPVPIYEAPHPGWGSSGIDLTDVDGDGDLDVLLAHGDMLDEFLIKPYHGIQWLENRGAFPFVAHDLAALPGVLAARAADLDGDGDRDLVAVTFVPARGTAEEVAARLPSLVWLEQTAPGRFERHTLETGGRHVSVDAADYDLDGDMDLVVGHFQQPGRAWLEVWTNLARTPAAAQQSGR